MIRPKEWEGESLIGYFLAAKWDDLLRLAATIDEGWRSATDVLERFGSAARGDRIYRAGHALGQLLRTVYLCDYFTLPDFRRPLYRVLERGESVHALQRKSALNRYPPSAAVAPRS